MDDPLSNGYAFAHDDIWRTSALLKDTGDASVFTPLDLNLPALETDDDLDKAVFDLVIPDLNDRSDSPEEYYSLDEASEKSPSVPEDNDFLADVWNLEGVLDAEKAAPKLRTWEAFEKKTIPSSDETVLLSEAGPAAFDAYITTLEPRIESGVLPQDYTLRALCNLALGRASTLFQWDDSSKIFKQTLPGVAISGSSKMCSESFVQELTEMGSGVARLRDFASLPRSIRKQCTAVVALQKCLSEMLDAVDESISDRLAVVRSLLQLRTTVQQARRLVHILENLTKAVSDQITDEAVISSLSDRLHLEIETAVEFRPALHALLSRVSGPWLEQLASDMGFSTSATTLAGHGVSHDGATDLSFISPEDRALLNETRIAVSALREQAPAHPLLNHSQTAEDSPLACFSGKDYDAVRVKKIAGDYRIEMLRSIKGESLPDIISSDISLHPEPGLDDQLWHDQTFQVEYFANLEAVMSIGVTQMQSTSPDSIKHHVRALCLKSLAIEDTTHEALSHSSIFASLECVRPLIRTQSRLVSGVLMRQLFRGHNLLEHLELQRSFHLFGNGEFVSRLSTALFSQDVQSAERRRGKLPTSETMGLRLGTTHEDRWPPASSELQLTLMGILVETYNGTRLLKRTFVQSEELPGSLSFSIRELPEEEIDRVLDPNSIYALDFLRLQYIAQAPLNSILTRDALQKYDDIFRHLLRLLRVVHVTADLGRKAAARRNETSNEDAAAFAHAAHHFISVLLSHVMDIGIAAPWRTFVDILREVEQTLAEEDETDQMGMKVTIGVEGLCQLHDACLERIRSRLFLKRKQEKLRNAIESTVAALLKTAFAIHHDQSEAMPAFTAAYDDFQKALSKMLAVLQEQADKPPKAIASDEIEDADMLRVLLARLNWNEFY